MRLSKVKEDMLGSFLLSQPLRHHNTKCTELGRQLKSWRLWDSLEGLHGLCVIPIMYNFPLTADWWVGGKERGGLVRD